MSSSAKNISFFILAVLSVILTWHISDLYFEKPVLGLEFSVSENNSVTVSKKSLFQLNEHFPETVTLKHFKVGNDAILIEPHQILAVPHTFTSLKELDDFLVKNDILYQALISKNLYLVDQNNNEWPIQFEQAHNVEYGFVMYWHLTIPPLLIFLLTAYVWAKVKNFEMGILTIAHFGMFAGMLMLGLLSQKELVVIPEIYKAALIMKIMGVMIYYSMLIVLCVYFPGKLTKWPIFWVTLISLIGIWVCAFTGLISWPLYSYNESIYISLTTALTSVFIAFQWFKSAQNPVARAKIKLLFSFMISGIVLGFTVYAVPRFLNVQLPIRLGLITAMLPIPIFLGYILAVSGLFLSWWARWLNSIFLWQYLFILFIIILGVFAVGFTSPLIISLLLTAGIGGWIFFPVRKIIYRFLNKSDRDHDDLSNLFQNFIPLRSDSERSIAWKNMIENIFTPAQIAFSNSYTSLSTEQNGLMLNVPCPFGGETIVMSGKYQNQKLFNYKDIERVTTLRSFLDLIVSTTIEKEETIKDERNRIARDLHDDIGSRLLSLVHTENDKNAKHARETLSSLKKIIWAIDTNEKQSLFESFEKWKDILKLRLDEAKVQNEIFCHIHNADKINLQPLIILNIDRILNEIVSNIIKHSKADFMSISLNKNDDVAMFHIINNGITFNPDTVTRGRGLNNIEQRVQELKNGKIDYLSHSNEMEICISFSIDTP